MKDLISKAEFNFSISNYEEALRIYRKIQRLHPSSKSLFNEIVKACEERVGEKNKLDKNYQKDAASKFNFYAFPKDESCAAVITLWKREDYLEEQIEALQSQTKKVSTILLIQNENHFEVSSDLIERYNLKIIKSTVNSLYTRWIIGYLLSEKYIYVLDDDVIPGNRWVEIAINALEKYNALIGPSGRRAAIGQIPAWNSVETFDGKDQLCDWVCNSYFFKREWINLITSADRYKDTQKTYDDIQLATTLKIFGGVNCVVPGQSKEDLSINGHTKRAYGHDENALWKRSGSEHMNARGDLINGLNNSGFKWVSND
jgi:hypothetical protein